MRDLDDGEGVISDPALGARLRRQAREVHIESALLGVALTGLGLLIPG